MSAGAQVEQCPPCGVPRSVYSRNRRFREHNLPSGRRCWAGGMTRDDAEQLEGSAAGDPDHLAQLYGGLVRPQEPPYYAERRAAERGR